MTLFRCSFLSKLVILGDFSALFYVRVSYNQDLLNPIFIQDFRLRIRCTWVVDISREVSLNAAIHNVVVFQWEHLTPTLQQLLIHLFTRVTLHLRHNFTQLFNNYFFTTDILCSKQSDAMYFWLTRYEFVCFVFYKYFLPLSHRHLRPILEIRVWFFLFTAQQLFTLSRGIFLLNLQVKPRIR